MYEGEMKYHLEAAEINLRVVVVAPRMLTHGSAALWDHVCTGVLQCDVVCCSVLRVVMVVLRVVVPRMLTHTMRTHIMLTHAMVCHSEHTGYAIRLQCHSLECSHTAAL